MAIAGIRPPRSRLSKRDSQNISREARAAVLGLSVLCFGEVVQAGESHPAVLGAECMTLQVSGDHSRLILNLLECMPLVH